MISTLDAVLLFLAGGDGKSGYDIRRLFQSTPLGVYSDSPGAIYPALARLETRGFFSSKAETEGRRRRVYRRTRAGDVALRGWIAAPIARTPTTRNAEELDMRFVITAQFVSWGEAKRFAARCEKAYAADVEALEAFLADHGQDMPRASRAALDLGIRNYKTRLRWCRDIIADKGVGK
jgi:DNA-binding PadR family transcriptional regulator